MERSSFNRGRYVRAEEPFKAAPPIKRPFSETLSSKDNERISKLEADIELKRCKLDESSEKIRELREARNSECVNYNAKIRELLQLKKEFVEMKLGKEREISECHATINGLREEGRGKEETIKYLEEHLNECKDKHASQQSVIYQQTQYIEELEQEKAKLLGSSYEETQSYQEKCEQLTAKIAQLESDVEEGLEMVRKQLEVNDQNEAVVEQTQREKRRLADLVCKRDGQIQNLKTELDKLVKFVEVVISCTEFPKSEQKTTVDLLEMLEAHILNKMGQMKTFCDLMQKTIKENGSFLSSKLFSTDEILHVTQNIPKQQPTTIHTFLTPPPPPLAQKASSSSSVAHHPYSKTVSPDPPLQEPSQQKTAIDFIDLTDGNDFYNELMSNVQLTLPSTSEQSQREMAKTTSFTRNIIRHVEDVKSRIGGQGPDNVGAKFYCICKFECNSQLQLEHHIKHAVHDGKFECPVCLQRFWKFGFWKSHIKSTHSFPEALDIEKYACGCQTCGEMFETTVLKKRHHCLSVSETALNVVSVADENVVDVNMRTPPETNASFPETTAVMESDDEQDYVDVEAFSPLVLLTTLEDSD